MAQDDRVQAGEKHNETLARGQIESERVPGERKGKEVGVGVAEAFEDAEERCPTRLAPAFPLVPRGQC